MKITIEAESEQEKEAMKGQDVVKEGLFHILFCASSTEGPVEFFHGSFYEIISMADKASRILRDRLETNLVLEREAAKINQALNIQQHLQVQGQIVNPNGRGNLHLRN